MTSQALKVLLRNGENFYQQRLTDKKAIVIPQYAFIDQIVASMKKYISLKNDNDHFIDSSIDNLNFENWGHFILETHTVKTFCNIYFSWQKYMKGSLQTQFLTTLLYVSYDLKSKLAIFLKLRRQCLKLKSAEMLDEVTMRHEDVIGVVHNVYSRVDDRKQIINGIKKLFISYKIAEAKIYACVFIEFALSIFEEQNDKFQNEAILKNKIETRIKAKDSSYYRSENKGDSQFFSQIHQDNGLYRKNKANHIQINAGVSNPKYHVICKKFTKQQNTRSISKQKSKQSHKNINKNNTKKGILKQFTNQRENQYQMRIQEQSNHSSNIYTQHQQSEHQNFGSISKLNNENQTINQWNNYAPPSSKQIIMAKYNPQNLYMKASRSKYHNQYRQSAFLQPSNFNTKSNVSRSPQQKQYRMNETQSINHSGRGHSSHKRKMENYRNKNQQLSPSKSNVSTSKKRQEIVIHRLSGSKHSKSKKKNNNEQPRNSEQSYNRKYRSPQSDIDFTVTPKHEQYNFNNTNSISKNLFKPHDENDGFKIQPHPIEAAQYGSWNKMMQHNQQFKQKMLHNNYSQSIRNQNNNQKLKYSNLHVLSNKSKAGMSNLEHRYAH